VKIEITPFMGQFRFTVSPETEAEREQIATAYRKAADLALDMAPLAQPDWLTVFVNPSGLFRREQLLATQEAK
jgi:hypothetical protein